MNKRTNDHIERIVEVRRAAQELWDNRLGHRDDNPVWSGPQSFWLTLGCALDKMNEWEAQEDARIGEFERLIREEEALEAVRNDGPFGVGA